MNKEKYRKGQEVYLVTSNPLGGGGFHKNMVIPARIVERALTCMYDCPYYRIHVGRLGEDDGRTVPEFCLYQTPEEAQAVADDWNKGIGTNIPKMR